MASNPPRPPGQRALAAWPVLVAAVLAALAPAPDATAADAGPLEIGTGERLLVIAPHPDDETIASAGLIQRVLARGGSARIVLVTAGDGYQDAVRRITPEIPPQPSEYVAYGEHRIGEAEASAATLGGERVDVEVLGFPDGGLKALLDEHWPEDKPERSLTTGAADPPYDEARAPALPYSGANLRGELTRILRETRPTMVCLPDPIDIHPDHSAAGAFTLLALVDWRSTGSTRGHRQAHRAEPLREPARHQPRLPERVRAPHRALLRAGAAGRRERRGEVSVGGAEPRRRSDPPRTRRFTRARGRPCKMRSRSVARTVARPWRW
ncbi:MAG: PIG-L family deacetylase [Deltaproteobacteria bacterium]|nr:PIG-L family deacetylase [Deltaproteobacteria bacterium]